MEEINMTNESNLYKVLKVKMKDFEIKKEKVLDDTDNEIIDGKTNKPKTKKITTNIIKITTKDIEYENNNKEKKIFQFTSINNKNIRQYHTLVKEDDVIRIIRVLNLDGNNSLDNNYIFIKDIITASVKIDTYKNKTKEFITLSYQQVDKNGIIKVDDKGNELIKNVKYKRLMASSGSIRNKKVTFIREDLWSKANDILLGGLPSDIKHSQMSKFNAYYALPSTDSTPVTSPKIVVVDDYKKDITETFDVVRPKKDANGNKIKDEYTCKSETWTETIKPFDGAGICDISIAKIWAKELGLYKEEIIEEDGKKITKISGYIPSYFQFRCIPGIKGDVYVMDIKKYSIKYKRRNITDKGVKQALIKDVFGNNVEILDSKGNLLKNVILTRSQFKFTNEWKELYGSEGFNKWQEEFEKEIHGYKRTFNIAKYGLDFKDIKHEVLLSYQPLQTLHFSKNQIRNICYPTIKRIKKISTNVDEFLKYRGLIQEFEEEQNKKQDNILVPQYYKALQKNKDLWNDKYIQSKVKEDIKGFKERSYKGAIIADGNYQVLIPDLVGLIQYAFDEEVTGCLKANQIYSKYWLLKKQKKVDIIRFPHIAMEHRVANVVQPEFNEGENWLEYIDEGIVTSIYDSIALALNSADFDGDKIMTISTNKIIKQVTQEMANTITFVDDEKNNAAENKKVPKINDMNKIIETDCMGMSNDIGTVVNKISQLWSIIPEDEEENKKIQDMIKIMSVIGSLTIDFVKTGIKSPIPPSILKFIKEKKILKPDFMKWKYSKIAKDERAINRNKRLLNQKEVELFGKTKCTVNKISWYMQGKLKSIEIRFDDSNKEEFNYSNFITNKDFNKRAKGYVKTLETMIELKNEEDKIGYLQNKNSDDFTDSEDNSEQYTIFYEYAKNRLMEIVANKNYKLNKEKMLDYLIYIVTNEDEFKKYNNKNLIWNTWGKELTRRLNDKKLIIRELDEQKIIKKSEEIKVKVNKKKKTKEKVYINIFNPEAAEGDQKEIEIFDTEIEVIKTIDEDKNRRLVLTMLILDKFCKAYGKEFNIANNKKSIKMYNIYHLSEINHKSIETHLKELKNNGMIEFKEKENGKVLECKVNINEVGKPVKIIKDVNNIKKLFKLIS
ncbi:hypothetical protein RBU49_02980 [Clostridium sp. MB40-C1]|uniref:hypothetical protein n=1 Tax=Clostridium sp. MB40-C1 TaxID=3070996 RepID=UPI0027E0CBC1|nr:hypothetical protein [Clostridium sp. MB40-C1]WMJ81234.1 hypothetical protein RBU49_02980 [Clostridium sp. MB40-C1]